MKKDGKNADHKDFDKMVEEYSGHAGKIRDFQNAIKNYLFSTIMIEGTQ